MKPPAEVDNGSHQERIRDDARKQDQQIDTLAANEVGAEFDPGDQPGRFRLLEQQRLDGLGQSPQWPGLLREPRVGEPAAQIVGIVPGEISASRKNKRLEQPEDDNEERGGQRVWESVPCTCRAPRTRVGPGG
jgi:hypothetical protein